VFAYFALQSDAFVERSTSVDGIGSADSRDSLWEITQATANSFGWLGSGAGTSETSSVPFNFKGLPIENSYFQLIISIGVPGCIALALLLLAAYRIMFLERNLPAVGAMSAYLVAIGGFAAIDGARFNLSLLGFLLLIATTPFVAADAAKQAGKGASSRAVRHRESTGARSSPSHR
jgi:polysaccharide biosynthesis protein PslJ